MPPPVKRSHSVVSSWDLLLLTNFLEGIQISHLGKRNIIIFKGVCVARGHFSFFWEGTCPYDTSKVTSPDALKIRWDP